MKKKDLVSFGNYLLYKYNITEQVTHADLENWEHDKKSNPFSGLGDVISDVIDSIDILKLKKEIIALKKQNKLLIELVNSYKDYFDEEHK